MGVREIVCYPDAILEKIVNQSHLFIMNFTS